MHSDAATVSRYIDSFVGPMREALVTIRRIVREEMPLYEESMKYRMPTYRYNDRVFAFAVQKRYLSVYLDEERVIEKYSGVIGTYSLGKNCIRYAKPEYIVMMGLRRLLSESYTLEDAA